MHIAFLRLQTVSRTYPQRMLAVSSGYPSNAKTSSLHEPIRRNRLLCSDDSYEHQAANSWRVGSVAAVHSEPTDRSSEVIFDPVSELPCAVCIISGSADDGAALMSSGSKSGAASKRIAVELDGPKVASLKTDVTISFPAVTWT